MDFSDGRDIDNSEAIVKNDSNMTIEPWKSSLIIPECVLCPKSKTYEECQNEACDMDIFSCTSTMSPNHLRMLNSWVIRFPPHIYAVTPNNIISTNTDQFGHDTDGWKLVRTIIQGLLDSGQGTFVSNGSNSKQTRYTQRKLCCSRYKLYQFRKPTTDKTSSSTTTLSSSTSQNDPPESHTTTNTNMLSSTTPLKKNTTTVITSLPLTAQDKCTCQISIHADDNSYFIACGTGNATHVHHPRADILSTAVTTTTTTDTKNKNKKRKRRFPIHPQSSNIVVESAESSLSATVTPTTTTTASTTITTTNVYETDDSLHMYFGFHYPSSGTTIQEGIPPILPHENAPFHALHFPQRVAQLLCRLMDAHQPSPRRASPAPNIAPYKNALDIGCAVGGTSFELAKSFDHVDGFDFSNSFIHAAQCMQTQPETVLFRIPMEADLYQQVPAVHNAGVTALIRQKVSFFTGDACHMDQMVHHGQLRTDYNGIVLSNLLCRLPDPIACLDGLSDILHPINGIVVIVTPYSWLTEYTTRENWLGGYIDPVTKKAMHSKDVLQQCMEERGFIKIHEEQMPLLIREHQRKYQYIISEATGWRKRT